MNDMNITIDEKIAYIERFPICKMVTTGLFLNKKCFSYCENGAVGGGVAMYFKNGKYCDDGEICECATVYPTIDENNTSPQCFLCKDYNPDIILGYP